MFKREVNCANGVDSLSVLAYQTPGVDDSVFISFQVGGGGGVVRLNHDSADELRKALTEASAHVKRQRR